MKRETLVDSLSLWGGNRSSPSLWGGVRGGGAYRSEDIALKVLALDTSTMMSSVAIVDGEHVIAEQNLNNKIGHSERLIPSIDTVLKTAGCKLADIDAFAVAIGPGSFTGLRIGLAAAKGFAFSLGRPVVGISSLKALAYNLSGSEYLVASILDARRGEYYIAVNRFNGSSIENILADSVMPPDELIDYIKSLKEKVAFVGDGVCRLRDVIDEQLGDSAILPLPDAIYPSASNIARLAHKRLDSGDADLISMCRPFIREPDLILRWERGDTAPAKCISCNRCVVTLRRGEPLECGEERRLQEEKYQGPIAPMNQEGSSSQSAHN